MKRSEPPYVSHGVPGEPDPRFRLDPVCFPQPLELELPEEFVERLQRMANETGPSLSELVHNLICQQLNEKAKEP